MSDSACRLFPLCGVEMIQHNTRCLSIRGCERLRATQMDRINVTQDQDANGRLQTRRAADARKIFHAKIQPPRDKTVHPMNADQSDRGVELRSKMPESAEWCSTNAQR